MVQRYDLFNWALNEIKNECKQTFRALSYWFLYSSPNLFYSSDICPNRCVCVVPRVPPVYTRSRRHLVATMLSMLKRGRESAQRKSCNAPQPKQGPKEATIHPRNPSKKGPPRIWRKQNRLQIIIGVHTNAS
jgi:hypothetical protein